MTYTQMIALLPDKDSPVETAGRAFFSAQTQLADQKKFLEFLLDEERYVQLFRLFYCSYINGHIDMKNTGADYLSVTGEKSTINTRYFTLFMQTVHECGISEEAIVPLMFAAATANKKDPLFAWKISSERFLTKLARADYDKAWAYLGKFDPDFKLVHILMRVDKERAVKGLTELAIFGKGVNKVALRNFLRACKTEVFAYVRPVYFTLKTDNRIAAVRLLLLFKNDADVDLFLREIAEAEKAQSILKLLRAERAERRKIAENPDKKQITKFFYDSMVLGTAVSADEFLHTWIMPPYAQVADFLFFGVYKNDRLQTIVIVDSGRVFDLENKPYEVPSDCTVKVLHPVELNPKTEFLARLNITQPFVQIKRKAYVPSAADKRSNGCFGVAGTVAKAEEFKIAMRKGGFRALHRTDGVCEQVGLRRSGIWCVLNIAPVDLAAASPESPVQAQSVRFYDEKDVIRLGGKIFVEGVTPLSVARIDPRMFSEFMYSVYELMGCQ